MIIDATLYNEIRSNFSSLAEKNTMYSIFDSHKIYFAGAKLKPTCQSGKAQYEIPLNLYF